MIPDLDIYRAAKLLIDRHGSKAVTYAAGRADLLLEKGDTVGACLWRAIVTAIEDTATKEAIVNCTTPRISVVHQSCRGVCTTTPGALKGKGSCKCTHDPFP